MKTTPPRVQVRLTPAEKKTLERARDRTKLRSLSEWARIALLKEAERILHGSAA